jgi:putative endonuclease
VPKIFTSEKQKIGETGENVASKFLVKHGFSIIERNYTKKWGEIDIVAEKSGKLFFVEVKSVSCETLPNVSGEASLGGTSNDSHRPEDNMHPWKLKRLSRTIQTYLLSNKVPEDTEWQVDLLVVYLDLKNRQARVKTVSDIII